MKLATASCLGSAIFYAFTTWRWQLNGDAALMHYVAFLLDRGWAPYRQILDTQAPGAYLPDWVVYHLFGNSSAAWRVYDLGLLAAAGGAMVLLTRRAWAAGFAAGLFAVIHGRDGIAQVGQRDLFAAVLLLYAGVAVLRAIQRRASVDLVVFGLLAGLAASVKPTLLPFVLLPISFSALRTMRSLLAVAVGAAVAPAICVAWLVRQHSLGDFWHVFTVVLRFHATLGNASAGVLLSRSVTPVLPLVLAAVLAGWLAGPGAEADPRRRVLLASAGLALISYLAQHKGYPYHRYPFLAFLLPWVAMELFARLEGSVPATLRPRAARYVAAGALLWGGLALAPSSAWKASRYDPGPREYGRVLTADLMRLPPVTLNGGVRWLDGRVQCLDTIDGCLRTLNELQLTQATGQLYDEFLFQPEGRQAVDESRARFFTVVTAAPPAVFIVAPTLYPSGPDGYVKLAVWPEFTSWLNAHYRLAEERTLKEPVRTVGRTLVPPGYRLYVLKAGR